MDLQILGGAVLLIIWAIGVWFDGPGWLNLFLTLGVFIIIRRVVVRGDRRHPSPPPAR